MDPVLIMLSPMLAYAALCALLGRRNRRTHDPPHIGVVGRVLEPPDDLPPALAAWLVKAPETTPECLLVATLCDLAQRGHLRIERRRAKVDQRRQRVTLVRTHADGTLAPFEQLILDTLFDDAPQIDLTHAAAAPLQRDRRLPDLYEAGLAERRLLDPEGPGRRRASAVNSWVVGLLGLAAAGATVALADGVRWWGWVLLILGVLVCYLIGDVGADVRGTTQRGADDRAAWRGYAEMLRKLTPESAPEGRFTAVLPYAVAFGALTPVSAAYRVRGAELPAWYRSQVSAMAAEGKTTPLATLPLPAAGAEEMLELTQTMEQTLRTPA